MYNDALSALDRVLEPRVDLPHPPPPYDDTKLTAVNEAWNILPAGAPAIDTSLKGRLRAFIWRMVGPPLETQRQFNAALVDHLNRNVAAHQEAQKAIASAIATLGEHLERQMRLQSHLIQYLQTVTRYVDTRDRLHAAEAEVPMQGTAAVAARLAQALGVAGRARRARRRAPRDARGSAGDGGHRAADGALAEARGREVARVVEKSEWTEKSG